MQISMFTYHYFNKTDYSTLWNKIIVNKETKNYALNISFEIECNNSIKLIKLGARLSLFKERFLDPVLA